jgi:hypothetical protein
MLYDLFIIFLRHYQNIRADGSEQKYKEQCAANFESFDALQFFIC